MPDRLRRLRLGNLALAALHGGQAIVILALSNDFSLPVQGSFLDGPPGVTPLGAPETLWDVRLGPAVAAFLLLAALDHLLVALPPVRAWYERSLGRGVNVVRWIEYSLSATIMVLLIAMLTGISDVAALIGIGGANAAMILFGHLMERFNDRERPTDWLPFAYGCVAGIVPWLAITTQIVLSANRGDGPPAFVYVIFFSLFALFGSFAINQWLQYAKVGRWRDYLVGEWGYLVLSLTAKSLLAWLVFANVLLESTTG